MPSPTPRSPASFVAAGAWVAASSVLGSACGGGGFVASDTPVDASSSAESSDNPAIYSTGDASSEGTRFDSGRDSGLGAGPRDAPATVTDASLPEGGEASACSSPTTLACGGSCVDPTTDARNCGGCGNVCATLAAPAVPVCWMGKCVACLPGSTRCNGAVPQTCDASGAWQSSAVTAGQCGAVCTPGAMQCSSNPSDSVQACGPDGKWDGAVTPCAPFACGASACKSTCATHADCSAGNFCWNSACVRAAQIAAGYHQTCALTTAGAVQCWGRNSFGQLGDGTTTDRLLPVAVSGLSYGASAVAAGTAHTCALTTAGGIQCWGDNIRGELGDGTMTSRLVPAAVSGLSSGASAVVAGNGHACALTTAGGVLCWGYNGLGALGDGTTTDRLAPVAVSGLSSGVSAIAAGNRHMCALTTTGDVQCWGYNVDGELGDGTTTNRLVPVAVSGLSSGASAVAAGVAHTCALTTAGGVQCWGYNVGGELGDGTTTNRLVPVAVSGLSSGVSAVAAGVAHTCALTTAGGVQCWGYNVDGRLGDGTMTNRLVPVAVSGLSSGVSAIAAGGGHTCALTTAGGVQCWGYNFYGELGDGTVTNRLVPVPVVEP